MITTLELIAIALFKVIALWILWELARALRASNRPPLSSDAEHVAKALDKVRRLFERIDARLTKAAAKDNHKHLNEEEKTTALH